MSEAPERIFCKESHDSWGQCGHWYRDAAGGGQESIRTDLAREVIELRAENEVLRKQTELADYITQDNFHNRLTPRIVDVAYTAFMNAFEPNKDDGGKSDWFNDTKPIVEKAIAQIRRDLSLEGVK